MSKTMSEITDTVARFVAERGWDEESATHLLVALTGELGELAEHYAWGAEPDAWSEGERRAAAYEFVDVLFYLVRLADRSGIDLEAAFDEKLPRLAEKYPAGATADEHRRRKDEYRRTGRNRLYDEA